nr:hypothetical protein [Tanacetum cinerariifolium]
LLVQGNQPEGSPKEEEENSMVELPLGLIQIPRIPAKFVGRCRCVCKDWNSYLSTPKFGRIHLCKQKQLATMDYKLLIFNSLDDSQPRSKLISSDSGRLVVVVMTITTMIVMSGWQVIFGGWMVMEMGG